MKPKKFDSVVIGGGQSGLAIGYYLAKQGRDFVILDAHSRVGDSWRKRRDSLRLFSPASFNRLSGMPFPAPGRGGSQPHPYYPTKDDMADYLEAYSARFELPVQLGVRVDELAREGDHYLITAGARILKANQVVVATGAYAAPHVPPFAGQLDPAITQRHSSEYRNPSQLIEGPVLVVGSGNSGVEIALESAAAKHPTWLAGRDTGYISGNLESFGYQLGASAFRAAMNLLTVDTLLGRRVVQNARAFTGGHPLVRVKPKDLLEAGVQRLPRVAGVSHGQPVLEDGRVLNVANVVWATGFVRDFHWIRLPAFDPRGEPIHHRGVVQTVPGLYFIGLPLQSSVLSSLTAGAGADAKYIAKQIAARAKAVHQAFARRTAGRQRQDSQSL